MRIEHDAEHRKFVARDDADNHMGSITYHMENGALSADHTWVDERYRDQGVAAKILEAVVAHAEENKLKVIPVCSYIAGAFEKHPERYRAVM